MGILDYYNSPEGMALLGLSAGLLEAGGPSRMPVSLGQGLGRGLLSGAQLGQNAAHNQLAQTYLGEQIKNLQMTNAKQAQLAPIMAGIASRFAPQPAGVTPQPQNPMAPGAGGGATFPQPISSQPMPQQPNGSFPMSLEDVALLKLIGGPDLTSSYNASKPPDAVRNLQYAGVDPKSEEGKALLGGPAFAEVIKLRSQPAQIRIPGTQIDVPTTQAIANAFNTGVAQDDTSAMQAMLIASQHGIPKNIGVGHLPELTAGGRPSIAGPTQLSADEQRRLTTGAQTVGEGDAKRVLELEQKIPNMLSVIRRLDKMEKLTADDNTYAAAGSELKTTLGSIAQAFGLSVNKSKTGNTEEYLAHVAELLKDRLASKDYGSGSGVSNLDIIAAKAPLPELAKTATGRQQIIQALRADTERNLVDAQAARDYFDTNQGLRGFRFPSELSAERERKVRDLPKEPGTPPGALPKGVTVKRIR